MDSLRIQIDELIQQKHLLGHYWYQRWQAGQLEKRELQGYVKEYYRFESEFPRFVSALHTHCDDLETRQLLLENLIHEEKGTENHPELWLRFAEGLGVSRHEVKRHFHNDETEHLVRTFRELTDKTDLIEGLAALYAYEKQQPDVARQKADGLRAFYNITDEAALEFFRVHQSVDIHHAEAEMTILEKLCVDDLTRQKALNAAQRTLDALYDFLDGVDRRNQAA